MQPLWKTGLTDFIGNRLQDSRPEGFTPSTESEFAHYVWLITLAPPTPSKGEPDRHA